MIPLTVAAKHERSDGPPTDWTEALGELSLRASLAARELTGPNARELRARSAIAHESLIADLGVAERALLDSLSDGSEGNPHELRELAAEIDRYRKLLER